VRVGLSDTPIVISDDERGLADEEQWRTPRDNTDDENEPQVEQASGAPQVDQPSRSVPILYILINMNKK
jgi:hypothetical protein